MPFLIFPAPTVRPKFSMSGQFVKERLLEADSSANRMRVS